MSKPQQRVNIVNIITGFSGPDNNIVIPRPFLKWCAEDLGIALFLSECLYWSDKTKDSEGWFARTAEEWQTATTLTRSSIDRAFVTLVAIGLERAVKRSQWHDFVPVLHYRFNRVVLDEAAQQFFTTGASLKIASSQETRLLLAEEGKKKKLAKSEKGLCLEHETDCVSNTSHELRSKHESYKEISREYEETIEDIAASSDAAPAPSQSTALTDRHDIDGDQFSAQAEHSAKTAMKTATDSPLQSSAKGSPRIPSRFEWAVNLAWQSNGMGSLISQLLGTAKAEGKRKTFKFETPATALEIYLFPMWWKSIMKDTPLPTAAETLKERFDQFRGHPDMGMWLTNNAAKFEYDYCIATGQTPTVRADGKRMVTEAEQAVASKRAQMLLDNFFNDYEDRDEDWITGDYVPAKRQTN